MRPLTYVNELLVFLSRRTFTGHVLGQGGELNYAVVYSPGNVMEINGRGESLPKIIVLSDKEVITKASPESKTQTIESSESNDLNIFRILDPRFALKNIKNLETTEVELTGSYPIKALNLAHYRVFAGLESHDVRIRLNPLNLPSTLIQKDLPGFDYSFTVEFNYNDEAKDAAKMQLSDASLWFRYDQLHPISETPFATDTIRK